MARIPPWSELEKGTNSGFDRDVCSRFATDEEGGAVDAREVQETADVVVLVECREKRLCVFSGKCEGSEGDWLAEACGQAAIAVHDFAEVFHNRRAIGARDAAPRPNSFVQILCKEDRSLRRECIATECFGEETCAVNKLPETRRRKDVRRRLRFKDAHGTGVQSRCTRMKRDENWRER